MLLKYTSTIICITIITVVAIISFWIYNYLAALGEVLALPINAVKEVIEQAPAIQETVQKGVEIVQKSTETLIRSAKQADGNPIERIAKDTATGANQVAKEVEKAIGKAILDAAREIEKAFRFIGK